MAAAIERISREYEAKATFYICSASEGARALGLYAFRVIVIIKTYFNGAETSLQGHNLNQQIEAG